jgi:hypothetical protein
VLLMSLTGCRPADPWFWQTPIRCAVEDGAIDRGRRGRSACEIREAFRAYVAQRQSCTSADECVIERTSPPLPCGVPVRRSAVDEVHAKQRRLLREYAAAGNRKSWKDFCIPAMAVACLRGYCVKANDL